MENLFIDALKDWRAQGKFNSETGDLTQVANRRKWAKDHGFTNYDPTKVADNIKLWNMMKQEFGERSQETIASIQHQTPTLSVNSISTPSIKKIQTPQGIILGTDLTNSKSGLAHIGNENSINLDNVDVYNPDDNIYNNLYAGNALSDDVVVTGDMNSRDHSSPREAQAWMYDIMRDPNMTPEQKYAELMNHPATLKWLTDSDFAWLKSQYPEFAKIQRNAKKAIHDFDQLTPEQVVSNRIKNRQYRDLISDPDKFFSDENKALRDSLSAKQWKKILKDTGWDSADSPYRKYLPSAYSQVGQQLYGSMGEDAVREANEKAAPYAAMFPLSFLNPVAAMGSYIGGYATDKLTQQRTGYEYDNWGDLVSDKWGAKPWDNSVKSTLKRTLSFGSNPGALVGGVIGGVATGAYDGLSLDGGNHTLQASAALTNAAKQGLENEGLSYRYFTYEPTRSSIFPKNAGGGKRIGMGPGTFNGGGQANYGTQLTGEVVNPIRTWDIKTPTGTVSPYLSPYIPLRLPTTPVNPGTSDYQEIQFPEANYNTLYAWHKSPYWIEWWEKYFPKDKYMGTTQFYPGDPETGKYRGYYVIKGGGRPISLGNYDASLTPGVHNRGTGETTTSVSGLHTSLPEIQYTGPQFRGTQIGASNATWTTQPLQYGETLTLKQGGLMSYKQYLK